MIELLDWYGNLPSVMKIVLWLAVAVVLVAAIKRFIKLMIYVAAFLLLILAVTVVLNS